MELANDRLVKSANFKAIRVPCILFVAWISFLDSQLCSIRVILFPAFVIFIPNCSDLYSGINDNALQTVSFLLSIKFSKSSNIFRIFFKNIVLVIHDLWHQPLQYFQHLLHHCSLTLLLYSDFTLESRVLF